MRPLWKLRQRRAMGDGRRLLPPRQLIVTAATLSVAAVVVSLGIVVGGLFWMAPATEKTSEHDFSFENHHSYNSHFTHEENRAQHLRIQRWCLGILLHVCRISERGLFTKSSTSFKPQQSPAVLQAPWCPNKWALHFISLSIRVLLFLLLVVAGDVERNPGPPKSRTFGGDEWKNVPSYELTEDDVNDVYDEVSTLAGNWRCIARSLQLPPTRTFVIAKKCAYHPNKCLFSVLHEWLKRTHDVQRHGCPSWRILVKAIANPEGGANPALAKAIAQKYQASPEPDAKSDTKETENNAAMSSAVPAGCDADKGTRKQSFLSAKFATLLCSLDSFFQNFADLKCLKNFLKVYSHPLYCEKLYMEHHVYCNTERASDIIFGLMPKHINFMNPYLLQEIINEFGDNECKLHYQEYKHTFEETVVKLRHHPPTVTDDEIEECSHQKPVKIFRLGDIGNATLQDVQIVQGAIMQATGISRVGQVFVRLDPGNPVIFVFLIPHCVVQLFCELCDEDLAVLANAGITKIQVEEYEITDIFKHTTGKRIDRSASSYKALTRELRAISSTLEYSLRKWQEIPTQQRSDLIALVKEVPESQLNEVCSEELLLEFSSCITNWRALAPCLGMQDTYYAVFTTAFPEVAHQTYELLLFWKRNEKDRALCYRLLETLILHGAQEEVNALIHILARGSLQDRLSEGLKTRYIEHANKSKSNILQADTGLVQLKNSGNDTLKKLDYSTRLETVEEFNDEIEYVSPKGVTQVISAAKPGTCISITGPRGIGKSTFIGRICHCWALGCGLRQYKLLFWIDLSTAADQPLNDVSQLLTTALTPMGVLTESEITEVQKYVLKTKGEHVLIILGHFSEKYKELVTKLLNLQLITVVVGSSQVVECVGHTICFHMLGLTERQISHLVLRYYHDDYAKAEHLLQYLSSVPNFSTLRRVPVYLFGLLSVFDIMSTAHPPQTLMSFLSCLALIMLNLSQDEFMQVMEQIASKTLPDILKMLLSPPTSNLQTVSMVLCTTSKSLFNKAELTTWPILPSFLRPVHFALPLKSGTWLKLTQYPLLNDFLASLHLYNQNLPAKDVVQHLKPQKRLVYFCVKTMPHILKEFQEQKMTDYILSLTSYIYEDNETVAGSLPVTEMHCAAVTARAMYSLTYTVREVLFSGCSLSPAASVILSNSIGRDSSVYTMDCGGRVINFVSSDARTVQYNCVGSVIHPLVQLYTATQSTISLSRFDRSSWIYFMKGMKNTDSGIRAMELSGVLIGHEGVFALTEMISITSGLKKLDLWGSQIGDNGAQVIAKCLKSCTGLQVLNLSGNEIKDEGIKQLAASLRSCAGLQELYLSWNSLTDDCVEQISELVLSLKSLSFLRLWCNSFSANGAARIRLKVRQRNESSSHSKLNLALDTDIV